jgi:hypothetical protein
VSTSAEHAGGPAALTSSGTDLQVLVAGLTLGLVDDAAVFPPAARTVPAAVDAHRTHRLGAHAEVVGPILVRASDTVELLEATRAGDDLRVGLVADSGLTGLVEAISLLFDHDDRATLSQVEIALPAGHAPGPATEVLLDQLAFSATAYVEVPRTGYAAALDALAVDGAERAKYRTGGTSPDAFPSETELAAFVSACLSRHLAFKLTAGLHRALRNTSPEGFEQHGFLNVLAAVSAGQRGGTTADLEELLAQRTIGPVLQALRGADVAAVRRSFVSFGCCDVNDPVTDLSGFGLLDEAAR